jgi:hypothetical protein
MITIEILAAGLLSPFVMFVLYAIGIQYERGGGWRALRVVAALALVLDLLLNFSLFALALWDWPRSGEWTFSKRLKRLNRDTGWRGRIARRITALLDRLAPSGQHVKT